MLARGFNWYRIAILISLLLVVPLGYGARFYLNSEQEWLRNLLGNIAYESFWIWLVVFLFPQTAPLNAAVGVCVASFAIEFLQLWHPAWLEAVRATLPGRLILGNSFLWADLPQYGLGSFVGWLWLWTLSRKLNRKIRV